MYIQEKVNPILEALVTAVLLERPEDPSFFMLRWLCEQTKSLDGNEQGQRGSSTADEIEIVRADIKKMQARKAELIARRDGHAVVKPSKADQEDEAKHDDGKSEKSTKAADEASEEEDEDDDVVDNMPPPPAASRGPRASVSAEAYGMWNQKTDFVAPVYEKTDDQKERINQCLQKSFLFNALEGEELNTILMAFKENTAAPEDKLIQQGDDGESMFLIETGKVECYKKIEGEEKLVKTCGPGDVFGELALLYNCPRAATVICKEEVTLWELDRETFNRIVKDAAANKRTTFTTFMEKVPLLKNLDSYEMMNLADALKADTVDPEAAIIKQGEPGNKFYMVVEGECIAKKVFVAGQEPQKVHTHKLGDYFGELALLNNEKRAASVFAGPEGAKLMWMDRKTFQRLLGPIESVLRREAARYITSPPQQ